MKTLRKLTLFITVLALFNQSPLHAVEITAGGQLGALGLAEGNTDTGLGFGGFVQASALDILGLQIDFLGSQVNHTDVRALVPNVLWTPVKYDELRFGLMAGPGFYDVGADPWRFGLAGGAFAEVTFIPHVPIGLQARYHSVFGGKDNDLWSVFMTIGYRFDVAGGSNDW